MLLSCNQNKAPPRTSWWSLSLEAVFCHLENWEHVRAYHHAIKRVIAYHLSEACIGNKLASQNILPGQRPLVRKTDRDQINTRSGADRVDLSIACRIAYYPSISLFERSSGIVKGPPGYRLVNVFLNIHLCAAQPG